MSVAFPFGKRLPSPILEMAFQYFPLEEVLGMVEVCAKWKKAVTDRVLLYVSHNELFSLPKKVIWEDVARLRIRTLHLENVIQNLYMKINPPPQRRVPVRKGSTLRISLPIENLAAARRRRSIV